MSNPSFSNIDLWLFELAEGNLSPKQIEQLEMFLLQHPELDVDRDVWEMAKLQKEEFHYPQQAKLERRRPVGMYITAASVFLFLAVSTSLWFLLGDNDVVQITREQGDQPTRVFVRTVYVNDQGNIVANAAVDFESNSDSHQDQIHLTGTVGNSNATSNPYESTPLLGGLASTNVNSNPVTMSNALLAEDQVAATVEPLVYRTIQNVPSRDIERDLVADHWNENLITEIPTLEITANEENVTELLSNDISENAVETNDNEVAQQTDIVQDEETKAASENGDYNERRANSTHAMYSSNYKNSLKSRMQTLGRKIQRMMDNPVALRNFKDPHYHVPGLSPMDVSFSSAGTMLRTRVQTTSRLQWFGQENQLLTNQVAIDGYAYGLRGGIGLQLNHGYYGDGSINDASAALTYSPKFSISRKVSIEPSLRFKMGTKSLTASKVAESSVVEMERGNTYDFYPEQTPIGKTLWYKDMGVGLMVNTEWFFAGVQLDNVFRHEDNIYQVNVQNPQRANYHFIGTVGTDWVSKKENLGLSPYIVYQNYGKLNEAWAGMNVRWNWLTVGAALSTGMEPAASLGIKFEQFALTYNADYTTSRMTGTKNLSHQLTLRFLTKPSRTGKRLLNL